MSYNIDSIDYISGELTIKPQDRIDAREAVGDRIPECNFLDDDDAMDGDIIEHPHWYGEGSGWSFEAFKAEVLARCGGSADLVLIWEGGDSTSGLRVAEGVVTEHEIVMRLGAKK